MSWIAFPSPRPQLPARLAVRALLLLGCVAFTGCVHSYASEPPLEFADLPYTSVQGQPWELKELELSKVGAKYKLGSYDHVAYVELNPTGERTLLFLHGLGSYLKFWRYQLDAAAAQGYRVLAFDQLGYGKSDKPAEFPYSMDAMAEVVDEFMEKTGTPSAVLVGNSMGGEVSMATALQFPQRVEAMVLVSPAGFEKFSRREKEWFVHAFSAAFVKSATEYGVWGSVRGANFSRWQKDYEWLIEERVRLVKAKQFDPYAYAQVRSVDGLAHNDFVRDSLGKIETPTLIVFGQEDRLIPNAYLHGGWARTEMSWGAKQIKGSQLVGLDHCGHLLQMDCHDELNPKMFEFIAALPPKAKVAPVEPPAAAPAPAPEPQTEVVPADPVKAKTRRTASARDYTKRQ